MTSAPWLVYSVKLVISGVSAMHLQSIQTYTYFSKNYARVISYGFESMQFEFSSKICKEIYLKLNFDSHRKIQCEIWIVVETVF